MASRCPRCRGSLYADVELLAGTVDVKCLSCGRVAAAFTVERGDDGLYLRPSYRDFSTPLPAIKRRGPNHG